MKWKKINHSSIVWKAKTLPFNGNVWQKVKTMILEYISKFEKSYFGCSYSSAWLWFQNLFIGPISRPIISWTHYSYLNINYCFWRMQWFNFVLAGSTTLFALFWAVGFGSDIDLHYHSKETPGWHLLWILTMYTHCINDQCLNDDAPNLMSKSYILFKCECQSTAALISTIKLTPQALRADEKKTNKNSLRRAHMVTNLCKCSN